MPDNSHSILADLPFEEVEETGQVGDLKRTSSPEDVLLYSSEASHTRYQQISGHGVATSHYFLSNT